MAERMFMCVCECVWCKRVDVGDKSTCCGVTWCMVNHRGRQWCLATQRSLFSGQRSFAVGRSVHGHIINFVPADCFFVFYFLVCFRFFLRVD